jgi:hypothetical protein
MTASVNEPLVHDVELVSAVWSGQLDVRLDDPYHFDHPLDHMPRMTLLGGLFELVRRSGAAALELAPRRAVFSALFPAFCELDGMVALQVARFPTRQAEVESTLTLLAEQEDRAVCEAELTVRRSAAVRAEGADTHWSPADQTLVHRRRQENVFVTELTRRGDALVAGVVPAPPGHPLATEPGEPYRIEFLVDAVRQFGTMICRLEHGRPADTAVVVRSISADLPCGLRSAVYLRWSVTPPGRGRLYFTAEVVAGDPDGEACGSVELEYNVASPAVYRRVRGDARGAL